MLKMKGLWVGFAVVGIIATTFFLYLKFSSSTQKILYQSNAIATLNSASKSKVFLKDSTAYIFSKVESSQELKLRDSIFVGPNSTATIILSNEFGGGEIKLAPNTIITLSNAGIQKQFPTLEIKQGDITVVKSESTTNRTKTSKNIIITSGSKAVLLDKKLNNVKLSINKNKNVNTLIVSSAEPSKNNETVDAIILSLEEVEENFIDSSSLDVAFAKAAKDTQPFDRVPAQAEVGEDTKLLAVAEQKLISPLPPKKNVPRKNFIFDTEEVTFRRLKNKSKLVKNRSIATKVKRDIAESRIKAEVISGEKANGPLYFRKHKGFWLQGGLSFVTQQINNPTLNSGIGDAGQLALRNGIGTWWKQFFLEGHWRESVINTTTEKFKPRWLQAILGVGFELPTYLNVTPHLSLYSGYEIYNNNGSQEADFLQSYSSPILGFRSRFIFAERWEIGGDAQITLNTLTNSSISKFFVQGDLRYWMTDSFSFGAGYWIDNAKLTASDGYQFTERSYAVETYIRWVQ